MSSYYYRLLLLLPILCISALPNNSPALRARTPQESQQPLEGSASLNAAQSAVVASEFARWTASVAAADASAASASAAAASAAYNNPPGAIWQYERLAKVYDTPTANDITCRAKKNAPLFNQDNCKPMLKDICDLLFGSANATYTADTWVWRTASEGGCALGYLYPSGARGVAPVPTRELCENDLQGIWGQMYRGCIPRIDPASGRWNAASVNVKTLPGGGSNG